MAAKRVSKGDAEAVLQAFGGGGWAIQQHSKVLRGAPADGLADSRVAIRPFDAWDGRRFCELDWHVILIADIEPIDETSSRADATATIEQLAVSMTLDGTPLQLSRTTVKRFLNPERFGLQDAVFAQWGRVFSPDELTVGAHRLSLQFGTETLPEIEFFIDPAESGTCA